VGVGVGKGAQTIVVLLASSIPEGELDILAIDFDIGHVVLKDGGDVHLTTFALDHRQPIGQWLQATTPRHRHRRQANSGY